MGFSKYLSLRLLHARIHVKEYRLRILCALIVQRTENNVPHRRAHSKINAGIGVMMTEMMLPQIIADPVLHRKMMNGVVHHIVTEITGDEPCKERIHEPWPAHSFE